METQTQQTETIEQLLAAAYGERIQDNVRAFFKGQGAPFTNLKLATAIREQAHRSRDRSLDPEGRERAYDLSRLLDRRERERRALDARLAMSQATVEPASLGALLTEQSALARIISDLQAAIADVQARSGALSAERDLWHRLADLAEAITGDRVAIRDLHLLPRWIVRRDERKRADLEREREQERFKRELDASLKAANAARDVEEKSREAEAEAKRCRVCESGKSAAFAQMIWNSMSLQTASTYLHHSEAELRKHAEHATNLPVAVVL